MKKYLLLVLLVFPTLSFAYTSSFSLTPTNITSINDTITVSDTTYEWTNGNGRVAIYDSLGVLVGSIGDGDTPDTWNNITGLNVIGTYHFVSYDNAISDCYSLNLSYNDCKLSAGYGGQDVSFSVQENIYTLSDMTNFATSTFLATAGFAYSDLTAWSGEMTKLIIGTGMGVFSHLFPWILAIIIIATILALAYRGFRFFKH